MSRVFVSLITIVSAAALAATLAFGEGINRGGEGTLPLGSQTELRGDGTLPLLLPRGGRGLILSGAATNSPTSQLATQVTITQASTGALAAGPAAALPCQISGAAVSKHAAQGDVAIGVAQYSIVGICFDSSSQTIEIVAAGAAGSSSLAGPLPAPLPSELSGRLILTGSQAGHYTFDVKGP